MSWDIFLRLATLWTRARTDVHSKALDWFDAQPASVTLSLARTLPALGAAVCTDSGALMPQLEQWSSGAAILLLDLLRDRWRVLPRECVAVFCERVAGASTRRGVAQACTQLRAVLMGAEPVAKRHKKVDDVADVDAVPAVLQQSSDSDSDDDLSLSLGDCVPPRASPEHEADNVVMDAEQCDQRQQAQQEQPSLSSQLLSSQQSVALQTDAAVEELRQFLARRQEADSAAVRAGVASQGSSVALTADVIALLNDASSLDRVRDAVADVSDEVVRDLFAALGSGLDLRVSSRAHAALVSVTLLPRVAALRKPVPRVLAAVVMECIKAAPRAAVDGLLAPLLAGGVEAPLGAPQAELVNRCLHDGALDLETKLALVRTLWSAPRESVWSGHAISVMQKALALEGLEGVLSAVDQSGFVARVNEQCTQSAADVKFGKLLQTFVNRFGALLAPATVEAALRAAQALTSIVSKPIVAKLKSFLK